MILLIDNYDSFTYNLYQYIGIFNSDIKVVRNDQITIEEIEKMNPERIVLSPGPKSPKEAGICMDVVKEFTGKKPILGICLGHQCIGEALGGTVSYAKALFHGKQSVITHSMAQAFLQESIPRFVWRGIIRWRCRKQIFRTASKCLRGRRMARLWRCVIKSIRWWAFSFIRSPFIPSTANASLKTS